MAWSAVLESILYFYAAGSLIAGIVAHFDLALISTAERAQQTWQLARPALLVGEQADACVTGLQIAVWRARSLRENDNLFAARTDVLN